MPHMVVYNRGILVGSVQCVTLGQKENQTFVLIDYLILMKKNERYLVNIQFKIISQLKTEKLDP